MENNEYSTKAMVEAALFSVIISLIMIIMGYLPFLVFIGILILPIPVAILYIRHNSKITIMAILISIILTSLVYNPIIAIRSAITCSIVGLTLGYCVKKSKKSSLTLLLLGISSSVSNLLTIAFSMLFIEKVGFINFITNKLEFTKQSMLAYYLQMKAMYIQAGVNSDQLKLLDQGLDYIKKMDVMLVFIVIPTCVFIFAVISAYMNYTVSKAVLNKLNYKMEEVLPFSKFCVSNIVGAILIGIVCIGIILSAKNITGGIFIRSASELLVQYVFIINGMAATTYFLRVKRKLSKPVVVLIIVLTTLSPLGTIYFSIGLMEMAFDFRKLDPYRIKRK
jgi:uncharacterized protein YybS (DUF2232 family)